MASLYELTGDYLRAYDLIDTEEYDEDMLMEILEELNDDIEVKAEGYAKVMKNLSAEAEALKKEEERLYARRKAKENAVSRMKKSLQEAMEATGKTKFKTELFSFNIQANAPSVMLHKDPVEIPAEYQKVTIEADKTAIKEALKRGEQLDFASLEQSASLRIR